MFLLLFHGLLLTGASYAAARSLVARFPDRCLAAALLGWGNLVVTSLLLSGLHALGDAGWFFRTSLLLAAATWLLLRRLAPEPAAPAPAAEADRLSLRLVVAFVLTLAPLAWIALRIAGTYEPNNYDSLAYHLPRVKLYLGQETLAHFSTGNDRQIYFPFNYNLLQLFVLIYEPPLQAVNFLNLGAWAVAGLAIFRLARLAGASANASLIAAWLGLTSTQILAQATATTNDLPTGAALLVALTFGLRWRSTRRPADALLAGLATGLAVGSKLTVIFFAPAAGLLGLLLLWQHARRGEQPAFWRGVRAWVAPALLAFAVASPFAWINLAEKGQWINKTYDYTLNRPFSAASVVQTAKTYGFQFFVDPLQRFTSDQKFTALLNDWAKRTFFADWNPAHAFSPFYLFPPDLNEDHVWFGFSGPCLLLAGLFCLVRFRHRTAPLVWLAWLGLGWFATYFLLNKWSLYNQRYFVLPVLLLGPCLAAVIDAGRNDPRFRRALGFVLAGLAITSIWFAGIYLFHNTSRPYAPLWAEAAVPPALPKLPAKIARRLAAEPRVNFDSTDGNERAFLFMIQAPFPQRFIASNQMQEDYYHLFSRWGFARKVAYSNIEQKSSYTIVHLPAKRTAGVEFLGSIGTGQSAIDYYGLRPHAGLSEPLEDERNVLVELSYLPRDPDRYKRTRINVSGLNAGDGARLTLEVEYPDRTRELLGSFDESGEAHASVTRPFRRFLIQVHDRATGALLGAIDLPYLAHTQADNVEASHDPTVLFTDELVILPSRAITGLNPSEGPYPQWGLPLVRWAKQPVVRVEIPENDHLGRIELKLRTRLQARARGTMDVVLNGQVIQTIELDGHSRWFEQTIPLTMTPGHNVLEFRNVVAGTAPDWMDYLARYPDVKAYLESQRLPLEAGARDHYEQFGRKEGRTVNAGRRTETIADPNQLYYIFSSIRLIGYRNP